MVHTEIPYSSFNNDSLNANRNGGLWDSFSEGADGPPGWLSVFAIYDSPPDQPRYIGFSGTFYGDVGVESVGGPNSTLYYSWMFSACTNNLNTIVTTLVGEKSYNVSIPLCPNLSFNASSPGPISGSFVVNSQNSIRLTVSVPYYTLDITNPNPSAYIGSFKFLLNPNAPVPPLQSTTTGIRSNPTTASVGKPNLPKTHAIVVPVVCGIVAGVCLLVFLLLVWRRSHTRRREDTLSPIFIDDGQDTSTFTGEAGSDRHRRMDGHGLEVVEKVRRGMPVAYPFDESLTIERGEKTTIPSIENPFNDAAGVDVISSTPSVSSQPNTHRSSGPGDPITEAGRNPGEHQAPPPSTEALPTNVSSTRQAILDLTMVEEQVNSLSRLYIPQTDLASGRLPTPATSSALVQRVGSVSQLLQQILASSIVGERSESPNMHPPAYDQGDWSNN